MRTPVGSRPPPRRLSISHHAPALSPASKRASSARLVPVVVVRRDREPLAVTPSVLQCVDIAGSNPPDQPVLRGRKLSGAHVAIDGHVVQSELLGGFLKRDGLGLCGHGPF